MSMAQGSTDLDRLIEEGLTLYGQGDLDGALLVWEQVLTVDPENAQANSYVDYVRMNYELLTSDLGDEDAAPFGIADDGEPEYQIEIMPGEAPSAHAPSQIDPLDAGWFIGEEPASGASSSPPASVASPAASTSGASPGVTEGSDSSMTLELDGNESSLDRSSGAVSFEDATREYSRGTPRASEPTASAEFSPEATPGFGASQPTDVRRRDLGFVRPTSSMDVEPPEPQRKRTPTAQPQELQITLRSPQHGEDVDTAQIRPDRLGELSSFDRSYAAHASGEPDRAEDDDLISSLPSPRATHVTRDLPANIVPPHQRAAFEALELDPPIEPPPPLPSATTRELSPRDLAVAFSATATQEFGDRPTQQVGRPASFDQLQLDPLVSAPTRELGLRGPGGGRTTTEEQPLPTGSRSAPIDSEPDFEGTRGDIVLSFDPIDARTAQILDEVDRGAPASEPREEKTRRRITALIDGAQIWAATEELDKAVAAIDLALSEDPNSALAQKLIHRNRETIMAVFQGFLGDLARQPALARPLHELGSAPISPRAAFLLSRVDGNLSIDELLDVSGMPRLEAYRYLCQLFLRGILR